MKGYSDEAVRVPSLGSEDAEYPDKAAFPRPRLGNTKNLLCRVGVVYLYPYSLKSSSLKTTHSTPNPPQTAATTPPIHMELGALSGTGAGVGVEVEVVIGVATKSGIELEIGRKASLF